MQVKLLDLQAQYAPLRQEIRKVIDDICDAQAFIGGPVLDRFEKSLAAYCGTRHAIGMSSGTDAILCLLMALGVEAGDEVIVPTFTFFATAGCVSRLGARPVFIDIDPQTYNIDPALIERRITPRTKAIMPVHLFGQMADMETINAIAAKHGLPVIEDACQAIGARRNGVRACAAGTAGDGGAICTNDDDLARKCRLLRTHGEDPRYFHKIVGANFRLDALQAGVLDVKLKYLDSWQEGRRRNAALYDKLFDGSKVGRPFIEPANYSVYNQYVVRLPNRDAARERLTQRGVGNLDYYPLSLHQQQCFAELGGKTGDCPVSEQACREVLALPIYPELREEEIRYVAAEVLAAIG